MRPDHYTPETICRCIELPGFETDPDITSSGEAIRLLLQPSFHPEVCITFKNGPRESAVSVVAARTMVWHLLNPAPVLAEQDQGEISMECFTHLATALAAASGNQGATSIVLDGMPVNALLMRNGELLFKVRHNAGPLRLQYLRGTSHIGRVGQPSKLAMQECPGPRSGVHRTRPPVGP